MPTLRVNHIDVFYREEGLGPPVILGHSSTGSGGQWRGLMAEFCGRYRVFSPDHIGYGKSGPYSGGPPLMQLELEAIETLLHHVNEAAHLVGHSYGGSLLARVAVRNPSRVRSLVLIEPTLFYLLDTDSTQDEYAEIKAVAESVVVQVESGDYKGAATRFIDYWIAPGAFDAMDSSVRTSVIAGMAKLAVEWPAAFEPWGATPESLRQLPVPVHLFVGSRTTPAARAVVEILRTIWPSGAWTEVAGAGHMGPVTHAEKYNSCIVGFLDDVERKRRQ